MSRAIVIGGGIAGLASAKVLAPFYSEVILYDAALPAQTGQLHVLLDQGQKILAEIFPGILEKCQTLKSPTIDWAKDTMWETATGSFPRYSSKVQTLGMSRHFLQAILKEEINLVSNIKCINERLSSMDNLRAELVVVAAGENFSLKRIFPMLEMKEQKFAINLSYRSFVFNTDELNRRGFKQYYYQIDPPKTQLGGVISPVEDNKTLVTLIENEESFSSAKGYSEFYERAERIPSEEFQRILGDARPVGRETCFRKTHIYRRTFKNLPPNVVIVGDALTSLNPVFGQGMTLALEQVKLLQMQHLNGGFNPKKFMPKCQHLTQVPFLLSRLSSHSGGICKYVLASYLRLCQRVPFFHHQFLKLLHGVS
jgi:2-polyprenyl-6-methoxyphenol hydroxylase-like FAD-dependent oxidoreductase